MELYLSDHALTGHKKDKWNAKTIMEAYQRGKLTNTEHLEGRTADVLFGQAPDGQFVGIIISKPQTSPERGTYRVVITGFAAKADYWRAQAG